MGSQQQPNSVSSNGYSNNQFEMNQGNYGQNLDLFNQRTSYPYVDANGQIIDGPNSQPLND
jgi:hypothetical protein